MERQTTKTRLISLSVPSTATTRYVSRGLLGLLVLLLVLGLSTVAIGAENRTLDIQNAPQTLGKPRAGDPVGATALGQKTCPDRNGTKGKLEGGMCIYPFPKGGCKELGEDCKDGAVGPPPHTECRCPADEEPEDVGGLPDPGEVQTPDN